MKSHRIENRFRFRPSMDDCERRELLSTAATVVVPKAPALLAVAPPVLAPVGPTIPRGITAMSNESVQGKHIAAYWSAGKDKVYIFAVEFEGSLTKSNAQKAFDWGKKNLADKGLTLANTSAAGNVRTTSSDNILLGWYNASRGETGWVAGTYGGSRSWTTPGYVPPWNRPWEKPRPPEFHTVYKVKYITNAMSSTTTVEGATAPYWNTRGYRITLNLNPLNGSGDVQATFSPPK